MDEVNVNVKDKWIGKNLWPVLLMVVQYSLLVIPTYILNYTITADSEDLSRAKAVFSWTPVIVSAILLLIYFIAVIGSLNHAERRFSLGETDRIGRIALALKCVSIPWFVINYGYWAYFFMVGGIMTWGIILVFIPLAVGFTWLIMMVTSVYSLLYLSLLKKEGRLSNRSVLEYQIFQMCFVADVISLGILSIRMKHSHVNT